MKVRCKKIINEHTQRLHDTSAWLTIGKEYVVLAIETYSNKNLYLIVDDSSNQAPHLHDAKQFEVLSNYIPSNWSIHPGDLDLVTLAPKAWQTPKFWEECYDGSQAALGVYKREARIIYAEEGAL